MSTFDYLSQHYMQSSREIRTDLVAIDHFQHASTPFDEAPDLFWEVYRPCVPRLGSDTNEDEAPPLPPHVEDAVLEKLRELEEGARVPGKPDGDESYDEGLQIYIHVAAARALRLKRKAAYADDVRQCVQSAWQAALRARVEPYLGFTQAPSTILSLWAVTGLVLGELFRVWRLDGKYEEALHLLANALRHLAAVRINLEEPAEKLGDLAGLEDEMDCRSRLKEYLYGGPGYERSSQTRRWHLVGRRIRQAFEVVPQEAVDTFENLRRTATGGIDWKRMGDVCGLIAEYGGEDWFAMNDSVTDAEGTELTWSQFWYGAQGWARAQLAPSELREFRKLEEEEGAERRLRTYFFEGELWHHMPERARRALVDLDRKWLSPGNGREESVLNDLRVAVETVLHAFVWEPLAASSGSGHVLGFLARNKELEESGREPGLYDYEWALQGPFFRDYIAARGLGGEEGRFLTRDLPRALARLRRARRSAEHDPKRTWRRGEVEPIVKEWLGSGCPGVLPRLVEIGSKGAKS